jgi:hypothetical protein
MEALLYLAKEGKVSGPFDSKQVESMKASGEFYAYEWMWDGQAPDWSPVPRKLSSPPGLPAEATKTLTRVPADPQAKSATPISQPQAQAPLQTRFQGVEIKKSSKLFYAVLFDNRQTLGGEVSEAHTRGARFISAPTHGTPLPKGSRALVDLLDEATDRSTKIPAQVENVSRMGDRWVIDLAWDSCPLLDA